MRLAGSLFLASTESNVEQEKSDQQKSEDNNGGSIHLSNIHIVILSSISNAVSKQSVARIPSAVNMTMLKGENPETVGTMIAAPIHPAARLVNNPDNTLALDGRTDTFTKDEYSIAPTTGKRKTSTMRSYRFACGATSRRQFTNMR